MSGQEKKFNCLLRHIERVEENCKILVDQLIDNEEFEVAAELMANARKHDLSKFEGIEWLHLCKDDPLFEEAHKHHVMNNPHHPEYWGSIHEMPRIYIKEMVCDWSSRNSELKCNKSLIWWIEEDATKRFGFNKTDKVYVEIFENVNLLLEPAFV